jgi:hypothetical protein
VLIAADSGVREARGAAQLAEGQAESQAARAYAAAERSRV